MPAFTINLDKQLYHPGDIVSGNVTCFFETFQQIEDIEVKLRGEEHTFWAGPNREGRNFGVGGRAQKGEFFGHTRFLANRTSMNTHGKMFEPGKYIYRYVFQLPKNVPGSYNFGHDYIRYYIKLVIKIPLEDNINFVKKFDVLAPIRLSNIDKNQTPSEMESTVCGPVTLHVTLNKNVYEVGEKMKIKADVTNTSLLEINKITVELRVDVEALLLYPKKCFKAERVVLGKTEFSDVAEVERAKYDLELRVPHVPSFTGSKLFTGFYTLKVTVVLPDCNKNVKTTLPVLIEQKLTGRALPTPPKTRKDEQYISEDISLEEDVLDMSGVELPELLQSIHISELPTVPEPDIPYPQQCFYPPYPPPLANHSKDDPPAVICRNIGFDIEVPVDHKVLFEGRSRSPSCHNVPLRDTYVGVGAEFTRNDPYRSPSSSNSPSYGFREFGYPRHHSHEHHHGVNDHHGSTSHLRHGNHHGHDVSHGYGNHHGGGNHQKENSLHEENSHHSRGDVHRVGSHHGHGHFRGETHHEGSGHHGHGHTDHHGGSGHHNHSNTHHHGDSSHHGHSDHHGDGGGSHNDSWGGGDSGGGDGGDGGGGGDD